MKISKKFPQFEGYPVLFIASGEYEAHLYVAKDGEINLFKSIKHSPRDDAREKQAFVGKKSGMFGPVAVSHRGAYTEDLKQKFAREVHGAIRDISKTYDVREICLFAPKYAIVRIMKELNHPEYEMVRMRFFGEYTKKSPLFLIETFFAEAEKIKIAPKINRRELTMLSLQTSR